MNNNLLLCTIGNDSFVDSLELKIFLNTIHLVQSDKYAIAYNLSSESIKKLTNYGIKLSIVENISTDKYNKNFYGISRYKEYYNFLIEHPEYENVLLTDSGDVFFQDNPFNINHQNKAWFNSEGAFFGAKSAPMNNGDQRVIKEKLLIDYSLEDCQVISSSIQYGSSEYIKQFLLLTYITAMCNRFTLDDKSFDNKCGWVTDQGIINFLYYAFLKYNPNFGLLTPNTSNLCAQMWAISEGVTIPNYDIEILENPLTIINKYTKQKYMMLHQWNRCKPPDPWEGNARPNHRELKAKILKEYA